MSDVYSSFERDHFTNKSKKRQQDFKSNKKSCRGYKVYEPKSSEKQQFKDQDRPNPHKHTLQPHNDYKDQDNYEEYNEYDDYDSKNNRYDDRENYQSKSYNRSGKRGTASGNKYTVWKKEIVKVNKDSILKSHEATPVNNHIDGLVYENSNLFVKDKQLPVNKQTSEPTSYEISKQQLSHKFSGESACSASTNATNDDIKSIEAPDFSFNSPHSVNAAKKGLGVQAKGRGTTNDRSDIEKNGKGQKENKDPSRSKECRDENQNYESLSDKTELNEDILAKKIGRAGETKSGKGCEETDESEGERYSNGDLVIQRKLLNNEVGSNSDVFDEAGTDSKKEEMDAFEDNDKPVWEDLDTKQALEDIKKQGFTYTISPQNFHASFTNSQDKGKIKLAGFFGDDEDNDDDFDQIFSTKSVGKPLYRPTVEINMKPDIFGSSGDLSTTIISPNNKTSRGLEASLNVSSSSHISFLQQYLEKQGNYNLNQSTPGIQPNGFLQGVRQISNPFEDQAAPPGFDKPKFVFKYCGHNYEAKIWFYIDSKNLMQGPYSARQMDEWYTANQLHSELSISKGMGNNAVFKPLSQYVDKAIQKELKNLSYDNDCIPCAAPIETKSPVLMAQVDPSYQEAQDILAAVDQYNLNAAQEMLVIHNIRETFLDEPTVESDTSISAQLFVPGRYRQTKRLAAFDNCNSRPDLDDEQNYDSQVQSPKLNLKCSRVTSAAEAINHQNVLCQDQSPSSATYSHKEEVSANTNQVDKASTPVVDVDRTAQISSLLKLNVEQPVTSPVNSAQDKPSLNKVDVPDYRVQPLSAAQIQLLQNFSWQAFANESVKSTDASSVKNE